LISYFDTSAVIPLVVAEPTSERCAQLWEACDKRVSSVLVVAEAHAALAQAFRMARITAQQHAAATRLLKRRLEEMDLVTATREIANRAALLAVQHALRGYDAVHIATALAINGPDTVAVTADRAMLKALSTTGVATADPTHP
jgi:predicted nucleic acid-binding protein